MALIGEVYVGDILGKVVLDPRGEEIGRVRDIAVEAGVRFPRAVGLFIEKRKTTRYLPWEELSIFNKRIISSRKTEAEIPEAAPSKEHLLIRKDLLDKQIVDIDGAKVVRVNDVRLTEEGGAAYLTDVDVGMRGILRRLGVERRGGAFFETIRHPLRHQLISWQFLQPLESRLDPLTLSVSRDAVSDLHPADLAQIMSDLTPEERQDFFERLDLEAAAESLHELEPEDSANLISEMDMEQAADIIEQMPPDEAADILADLPGEGPGNPAADGAGGGAGRPRTAPPRGGHRGGPHDERVPRWPPGITVGESLERFKAEAGEIEYVNYIYVVEEEKLLGVVGLRDLLIEEPGKRLSEVMHTKLKTAYPETGQETVAALISKYYLLALPVVDEENRLLGVVTVDDVVDLLLPPASRKKRRMM